MVTHLGTVHLPIYVGVLSALVTTAWALVARMRQSRIGIALPVAFVGALVAATGEAWHAYIHLHLRPHGGAIAGVTALFGFVVVTALWLAGRHERRRITDDIDHRRAA